MTSIFPPELIQEFITYIDQDADKQRLKTLYSCSLVSRIWCDVSRPFLYSQVVVNAEDSASPSSLINTLDAIPRLRSHVHSFLLALPFISTETPLSILAYLNELPGLRSLKISSSNYSNVLESPGLDSILCRVLDSRVLTRLELSCLQFFPPEPLRFCVALQHLTLHEVIFSDMEGSSDSDTDLGLGESVEPPKGRPVLKTFTLSTQSRLESDILITFISPQSPVDVSQLTTFMGVDRCNTLQAYNHHCRFISHVSRTLKTVFIDPPSSRIIQHNQDPLGPLKPQELQVISDITLCIIQRPSVDMNSLPWIVAFLSRLPNPGTLEQLTLLCDIEEHDEDFTFHSRGWSELDIVLITRFPNLRSVHLKCFDEPRIIIAEDLLSWLYIQLPVTLERGILIIEYFSDLIYTDRIEHELMLSDPSTGSTFEEGRMLSSVNR